MRLAVTDLRTGRLPTRLIWPTAGIVWLLYAVASLIEAEPGGLIGASAGAVVCGAIMAAVHFIHPPGMGFGDVRLSVLNGLLCGWWGWDVACRASPLDSRWLCLRRWSSWFDMAGVPAGPSAPTSWPAPRPR